MAKQPIKWIRSHDPGKESPMPKKGRVKLISPAGTVAWLSLRTGAAAPESQLNYGNLRLAEKLEKGWVLYDDEGFDSDEAREAFIAERQNEHARLERERSEQFKRAEEKMLEHFLAKAEKDEKPRRTRRTSKASD